MAMGTRKTEQPPLWIAASDLPMSPGHPFYARLNAMLDAAQCDRFVEERCAPFYAPVMGRPSLTPGRYFRLLLIGYFEGIDSERGIAWRAADSLAVRSFLGLGLDAASPDHSTISRTRRLIDVETHRTVFTWVQQRLVDAKLLRGKTVGIDATTLEANAAMRSIVRRDTGEGYVAFLTRLAVASGIKTPTREALPRLGFQRKVLIPDVLIFLEFLQGSLAGGDVFERTDFPEVLAQQLGVGVSEHLLKKRIAVDDPPRPAVQNEDAVLGRLEKTSVPYFGGLQRLFYPPSLDRVGGGVPQSSLGHHQTGRPCDCGVRPTIGPGSSLVKFNRHCRLAGLSSCPRPEPTQGWNREGTVTGRYDRAGHSQSGVEN
jgi:transposase